LVLCRQPSLEEIDRIAQIFGVDHPTFWQLYEKNRGAYDKNDIGGKEYWRRFAILISMTIPSRSCCGGTLKYGATLKNVCSPGHGRCEWPVSNGSTLQPASQVFRPYPFEFGMVAVV